MLGTQKLRPGQNGWSHTSKSSLTLLLAATSKNQPLWIHRGKVLCCLKAQSNICSDDDDCLACKIDVFHWGYLPPQILDVLEKIDSSHDIEHEVQSDFAKCPYFDDDDGTYTLLWRLYYHHKIGEVEQ